MRNTAAATLLALSFVGGVFAILHHQGQAREQHLRVMAHRTAAPDFTRIDLDGKPLQLRAFRGKVVLLDYWATWCAPCKVEVPHLVEFQKKYGPQGLQIIGISMDDNPAPVKIFAREFGMNYPIVLGNAKLAEAYGGVLGLPVAFLIDRDGRTVKRLDGDVQLQGLEKEIVKLIRED